MEKRPFKAREITLSAQQIRAVSDRVVKELVMDKCPEFIGAYVEITVTQLDDGGAVILIKEGDENNNRSSGNG
jgi:hypothetical protein